MEPRVCLQSGHNLTELINCSITENFFKFTMIDATIRQMRMYMSPSINYQWSHLKILGEHGTQIRGSGLWPTVGVTLFQGPKYLQLLLCALKALSYSIPLYFLFPIQSCIFKTLFFAALRTMGTHWWVLGLDLVPLVFLGGWLLAEVWIMNVSSGFQIHLIIFTITNLLNTFFSLT